MAKRRFKRKVKNPVGVVVGARIRQLREAKGMTQEQLARAIGTSFMQVSNWERDVHDPDLVFLVRIARVLGQSLEYFVKEGT